MPSNGEMKREPLPCGGLDVLTDLITHQDTTTWTVLSVFLAAEFLLVAVYVQSPPTLAVFGTLGMVGLVTTVASLLIVERSQKYLAAYYDLAKRRCHPQDSEIFDVQIKALPRTRLVLRFLHYAFLLLWALLTAGYFLILWLVLATWRP